jgi:hypothetical protein
VLRTFKKYALLPPAVVETVIFAVFVHADTPYECAAVTVSPLGKAGERMAISLWADEYRAGDP